MSLSRSLSGLTSAIRSYTASSVPKFADRFAAVFIAAPGDTGDVVGRVALEGLVVDHLAGDEIEPVGDLRGVVQDGLLHAGSGVVSRVWSVTSWSVSRSPVTIVVSRPRRFVSTVGVPDDIVGSVAPSSYTGDRRSPTTTSRTLGLVAEVVRVIRWTGSPVAAYCS